MNKIMLTIVFFISVLITDIYASDCKNDLGNKKLIYKCEYLSTKLKRSSDVDYPEYLKLNNGLICVYERDSKKGYTITTSKNISSIDKNTDQIYYSQSTENFNHEGVVEETEILFTEPKNFSSNTSSLVLNKYASLFNTPISGGEFYSTIFSLNKKTKTAKLWRKHYPKGRGAILTGSDFEETLSLSNCISLSSIK